MRRTLAQWISRSESLRILCIGVDAFDSLIADGRLSVRDIPGSRPRYLRSEVEALAASTTTPASRPLQSACPA